MSALRALIFGHRRLAVLALAAVLVVKLLVPGGYMIERDHGRIIVSICSGTSGQTMVMEMPGMAGDHSPAPHDSGKDHTKADMPCAFAGLFAATVAPVDPLLLLAALAIAASLALLPMRPRILRDAPYLRPPLRGPPARLRLR